MELSKNSKQYSVIFNVFAILMGVIIELFAQFVLKDTNILMTFVYPVALIGSGLVSIICNAIVRKTQSKLFVVIGLLPILVIFIAAASMLYVTINSSLRYLVFYNAKTFVMAYPFWLIYVIFFSLFSIFYIFIQLNGLLDGANLVGVRNIRRKLATAIGLIFAVSAVVWLFVSDVKISSEVKWLLATLLGVLTGAIAVASSYFLGNAESKAWLPLDIVATLFGLGFIFAFGSGILGNTEANAVFKAALNESKLIYFAIGVFAIGIIALLVNVFSLLIDIVVYNKLDKDKML